MDADIAGDVGRSGATWSGRPEAWALNARLVFDVLLAAGALTRGEIAERTELSRVTASGVVEELMRRGFVQPSPVAPTGSGGPRARTYSLVPGAAFAVGVAAYLDRIVVSLADITGDVVAEATTTYDAGEDAAALIHGLILSCFDQASAPGDRLRWVVVGTQGVVEPTAHHLSFVTNVRSWQRVLTERLGEALGCPVDFENDINLAAVAELTVGAGRDASDLVLAWLDEGVALGITVGRKLLRGDNGWAGEIGFLPVVVTGAADNNFGSTRRTECSLQDASSTLGLAALAQQFGVAYGDFLVALRSGFPGVTDADALLEEIAFRVSLAVAPAFLVLDPDVVVLAGRTIVAGGERLLERVRPHLDALGGVPTRICVTDVATDPIAQGAVLLALDDARDALFVVPPASLAGATP